MGELHWQQGWDPFRELHREVGRFLGGFEPLGTHFRATRGVPAINLYDSGDQYVLMAQVPGLGPEDVELSIVGETLTIRGERKRADGVPDESYRRQERTFGRWVRAVTLPGRVVGAEVSASYANGVLAVVLPKAEDARPRQISINAKNA